MACAKNEDCSICTNNFDSGQRQAVELPCGHEFCLSCLVTLKARSEYKCPRCRRNWADMDIRALPVMGALAAALDRDVEEEENDLDKKKKVDGCCKKHSLPFDFWVREEKDFYCKRCAAKQINVTLELIDDAIPDIKATLGKEAQDAGKKVKEDMKLLDNFNTKIEDSWSSIKKFKKLVDDLDILFKDRSKEIQSAKSTLTKSLKLIEKVEGKVATIANEADVDIVMESRTSLLECTRPSRMPSLELQKTLLSDIADSYTKKTKPDNEPTREAFIDQFWQGSPVKQQIEASMQLLLQQQELLLYQQRLQQQHLEQLQHEQQQLQKQQQQPQSLHQYHLLQQRQRQLQHQLEQQYQLQQNVQLLQQQLKQLDTSCSK